MMFTGKEVTCILGAYLLGCCTAGYYWVRWRTGQDIRTLGTGNVGARNVGRSLGPSAFLLTLAWDCFKGGLAVFLASHLHLSPDALVAVVVAAVVGHSWPIQLGFKGGKGIAASLGALLVYDPVSLLILLGLFLSVLVLLRTFTLSGMLAYAVSPLAVFLWDRQVHQIAAVSFVAILVLITHRKNIREDLVRWFALRRVKSGPADSQEDPNHEL